MLNGFTRKGKVVRSAVFVLLLPLLVPLLVAHLYVNVITRLDNFLSRRLPR